MTLPARSLALAVCSALVSIGCGGGGSGSPPVLTDGSASLSATNPTLSGTDTDGTASGTDPGTGTSATGSSGTTEGPPTNCADLMCAGPGSCIIDDNGEAYCACDEGYVLDIPDNPSTCVVDETCINVRFLENRCRQKVNAEPAVALFFGLDFCAGTAVTPDRLEELGIDFLVLENEVDVEENVESSVTFIDTSVENYVNLVVDVSDSLTDDDEFLPELVTALRAMVDELEPAAGDPDVYVGMYVFGRSVAEYVPFTRDFATIRAAIDTLQNDPATVVDLAGGGQGTDLFEATKEGIENTQRIRDLRDAVTWGGVLSTGTVVVITDGIDSSNGELDTGLIDATVNQVISVGLGVDIDDAQLRAVGRDGNFLAPTAEDLADAFTAITTRVKEYPLRSYMLAYCSSTTEGTPDVEVSMQGGSLTAVSSAVCRFSADLFSSEAFECSDLTFTGECNSQQCGGLTACGACSDDQCCTLDGCADPTHIDAPPVDGTFCINNPETCGQIDEVCDIAVGDGDNCVAPAVGGFDYLDTECAPGCEPGVQWCNIFEVDDVVHSFCEDVFTIGSACDFAEQCETLNCYFVDPDNPFDGRKCLPPARIFDHCGPEDAVCEDGSYCAGSSCEPKFRELVQCSTSEQCRRARCFDFGTGNFCSGFPGCYWGWDEKVPG